MATITNPFGRMNTGLGTSQRESTGEGLAKIVATSLQGYAKVKEIDKKFDEQEDADLGEAEMIAYNSTLKQMRDSDVENGADAMSSKDYGMYKSKQREKLEETVGEFASTWSKKRSSSLVSVFDARIAKATKDYNVELFDAFVIDNIPEFSKTAVYGSEEFDAMYKTLSSYKTGEEFNKEDYVNMLANSNLNYLKQVQNQIAAGNVKGYNEEEIASIRKNTLAYVKNPDLLAKLENGYATLDNAHKSYNGNEFEKKYLPYLYGDASFTYSTEHKTIAKRLKDSKMDDGTRTKLTARLQAIKVQTYNRSKGGQSKEYKALLTNFKGRIKNTFSGDENSLDGQVKLAIEMKDEEAINLLKAKRAVFNLVSKKDYSKLSEMMGSNGTIVDGTDVLTYKKSDIANWAKLYVSGEEAKLETLTTVGLTDANEIQKVRVARTKLLSEIKQMDSTIKGIKSNKAAWTSSKLKDTKSNFTSIDDVEDALDYGNAFTNGADSDAIAMQNNTNILKNVLASAKTQYAKDPTKPTKEESQKIVTQINIAKNNLIFTSNRKVEQITAKVVDKIEDYTTDTTFTDDVTPESYTSNVGYAVGVAMDNDPSFVPPTTQDGIEKLFETSTQSYDPSDRNPLVGVASGLSPWGFSDSDNILLPASPNGKDTTIKTAVDNIWGKTIRLNGKDIAIPNSNDVKVLLIKDDTNNNQHIQLKDKETNNLILDMPEDVARTLVDAYGFKPKGKGTSLIGGELKSEIEKLKAKIPLKSKGSK